MPIASPSYRFVLPMLAGAPEARGVYALWDGEEMIYLACATGTATIKALLLEHLANPNRCVAAATHYSWELSLRPAARETEILKAFVAKFGRPPRCNQRAA